MPGLAATLLRSELDLAVARIRDRLDGLQHDEFFWQPVPGCWTVSRRGEAVTPTPMGRGDWVIDEIVPEPRPAPCTTIAWRLCHLVLVNAVYYDHLFGDRALGWDDVTVPDGPSAAVDLWHDGARRLSSALAPLSDDDLGADVEIEWWGGAASCWFVVQSVITENAHHGAEIGCLRDLYRWSTGEPVGVDTGS